MHDLVKTIIERFVIGKWPAGGFIISRIGQQSHDLQWFENIDAARQAVSDTPPHLISVSVTLADLISLIRENDTKKKWMIGYHLPNGEEHSETFFGTDAEANDALDLLLEKHNINLYIYSATI